MAIQFLQDSDAGENGKEWDEIPYPMLDDEWVMTYYPESVPCYHSYTAPFACDSDICYYRFDHEEYIKWILLETEVIYSDFMMILAKLFSSHKKR